MDYYTTKQRGEQHTIAKQINRGKNPFSRSCNNYGSHNKVRGVRRIADRHSHHRVRNRVRSELAHKLVDGLESMPESTSTGKHNKSTSTHAGSRSWVTNRKGYGPRYNRWSSK